MYEKMYLHLFNAVTDALHAMERQSYCEAMEALEQGQLDCEEIFVNYIETARDDVSAPFCWGKRCFSQRKERAAVRRAGKCEFSGG